MYILPGSVIRYIHVLNVIFLYYALPFLSGKNFKLENLPFCFQSPNDSTFKHVLIIFTNSVHRPLIIKSYKRKGRKRQTLIDINSFFLLTQVA